MFRSKAKIIDQAVARLKRGESLNSVLSSYPANMRHEISEFLAVANLAISAPKTIIPAPTKRKLYLDYQPKESWLVSFVHSVRFTYPAAVAAIILMLTGTYSAAMSSLPGDKLFALKKAVETTQLKMTSNPEEKAQMQLQFANQRLADAQKVIAENQNPEAKSQAIDELKQQTTQALNNVKEVASTPSTSSSDFINKIEKLAKDQGQLVASVDSSGAAQKDIAKVENTVSDIKKLFAAANDQSSAQIPKLDKIEATGAISAIKNNVITVEGNKYQADSKNIQLDDFSVGDTIKITGHIQGDLNIADSITLVTKAPATVKKDTTAPAATRATEPTPKPTEVVPAKPNDTFTGFIPEPPASQQ